MAKFLIQGATPGTYTEEATVTTGGTAAQAGKVPELDDQGRLKKEMMPADIGGVPSVLCIASEALAAGQYVNIYDDAGVTKARKALAVDVTHLACGYVLQAVAENGQAKVYTDGQNDVIPVGTLTPADVCKEVCLSAIEGGAVSLVAPGGAGNVVQPLGRLVAVNTVTGLATVDFELKNIVIRA